MKKLLLVLILCVAVLPLNADIFDDVENGNQKAVANYIANGGDVNILKTDNWNAPLIIWASKDWNRYHANQGKKEQHTYAPIVKMLIDAGADVNAQNSLNDTAILEAASGLETKDRIEITKLLLKAGADQTKKPGQHPIYWASYFNCPEILKLLIAAGGEIETKTNTQYPIMTAVLHGNTTILEILAKNGADLYKDDLFYSAVSFYLSDARPRILSGIKTLIKLGVDVNVPREDGKTPLMRVAKGGEEPDEEEKSFCGNDCRHAATPGSKELEEITKIIWNAGASKSVNAVDENGWTALMYAIQNGNTEMVKFLLTKKANLNIVTKDGNTALIFASENGNTEIVKTLLAAGAKVNTINKYGQTALMYASQNGHTDIVKVLLDSGANVNAMNTYGGTALMTAADKGHTEIVKTLLNAGANVNAANKQGYTSLIVAAKNGHIDTVKTLLAAKPDINAAEKTAGWNALIFATQQENNEMVKLLIDAGANISATNKYKYDALMIASILGNEDIVKTLIAAGANINTKDGQGKSALRWAKERGHDNIVKILLAAGAKK